MAPVWQREDGRWVTMYRNGTRQFGVYATEEEARAKLLLAQVSKGYRRRS